MQRHAHEAGRALALGYLSKMLPIIYKKLAQIH